MFFRSPGQCRICEIILSLVLAISSLATVVTSQMVANIPVSYGVTYIFGSFGTCPVTIERIKRNNVQTGVTPQTMLEENDVF